MHVVHRGRGGRLSNAGLWRGGQCPRLGVVQFIEVYGAVVEQGIEQSREEHLGLGVLLDVRSHGLLELGGASIIRLPQHHEERTDER